MTLPTPPPGFLPQTATALQRMQQRLQHAFPVPPGGPPLIRQAQCTAEHRPPQGPNEDSGICLACGAPSYARRPVGETFGWHADDCSLDVDHPGYCAPGGAGHEPAPTIRGYWPEDPRSPDYRPPT